MRQLIGDVLPFVVIVMVSPINIAAILLLFSKRGESTRPAISAGSSGD